MPPEQNSTSPVVIETALVEAASVLPLLEEGHKSDSTDYSTDSDFEVDEEVQVVENEEVQKEEVEKNEEMQKEEIEKNEEVKLVKNEEVQEGEEVTNEEVHVVENEEVQNEYTDTTKQDCVYALVQPAMSPSYSTKQTTVRSPHTNRDLSLSDLQVGVCFMLLTVL